MFLVARILLGLLVISACSGGAARADVLPGPYLGVVERVVDGDTLAIRVTVWLDLDLRVLVRVRGIDAPEMRGRCDMEKSRAAKATVALQKLIGSGAVVLTEIEGDKYFGRVLADVGTPDGKDIGASLLAGGFVRSYDGRARAAWCAIGAIDGPAELAKAAAP
jgi:endonuclease YncB( thermonuclease family)